MKQLLFSLSAAAAIVLSLTNCQADKEPQAPVALTWEMGEVGIEPGYYENSFVLKNVSDQPIGKEWCIYFSQLPRKVKQTGDPSVKVEMVNGNFFRFYPTDRFEPLAPGDSMRITFRCTNPVKRNSQVPEGTYWVPSRDGATGTPLAVPLHALPLPEPEKMSGYPDAALLYDTNERLSSSHALKANDILPSVKQKEDRKGSLTIGGQVALHYDEAYANEAELLKERLNSLYGIKVSDKAPVTVTLATLTDATQAVNDEYYTLTTGEGEVRLSAATPHGIFNATQTLLAMLKGQQPPYQLNQTTLTDYPDLAYRGMMLDIARNYTAPGQVKQLVDILASYKLNVLHFHFCDDEGWRLEIPGLEELTAVGGRRGHTTDESGCLYPGYDGKFDPTASTTGNGYFTREAFIDLLRHATKRHVRVIPEIESPGHARAAIVAMKARYNKYIQADPAKAEEYMLWEPADTSRYYSVQSYKDNVINVALPSTYRFMAKVIDELQAMYREAGAPLTTIHLGGDEVARGAWIGSPACQQLMQQEGMEKRHDLTEYFFTRMARLLDERRLHLSGWQEVAQGHSEEGHSLLRPLTEGVYCWSTLGASADVVYRTANNGYPVILCNVNNFYVDLAYSYHPDEHGLNWGGCVDESISFSMLPWSIYRSRRVDGAGRPIDLKDAGKGRTELAPESRKNIVGVQAQLFSETIRSFEDVQYYILPKILGLVERGWNTHTAWESLQGEAEQQAFDRELALYYDKISAKEMPQWSRQGLRFRLPHPGLKVIDGQLLANSPIRKAEIRYTLDGSLPTPKSALWEGPVACRPGTIVRASLFYQGAESLPITYRVE